MKYTVIFCFALLMVTASVTVNAQAQSVQDITGRPFQVTSYTDTEGSPFLYDDWTSGTVKIGTSQVYSNVFLKYNELEGKLYFKGKNDEVLEFVDPVIEFTINGKPAAKHFITMAGTKPNQLIYYELIADGSAKFLKRPVKEIQEVKVYGSSTAVKSFVDADKYFVLIDGKTVPVKKDKKAIMAAIGKKQPELEAYIKSNSLNLKNDADVAKLMMYYNAL